MRPKYMNTIPIFGTKVKTKYGIGTVQGKRKNLETGIIQPFVKLIVRPDMTDEMKHAADGRSWVYWYFDVNELEEVEWNTLL